MENDQIPQYSEEPIQQAPPPPPNDVYQEYLESIYEQEQMHPDIIVA